MCIPVRGVVVGLDSLSPAQRSERMSRVRGRGNRSTEQRVATALRAHRINGWRRHFSLPGRPDFFFPTARLAVFVHGCFWHGCMTCKRRMPVHNRGIWREKILGTRRRDRRVGRQLRARSIGALTIWEHELSDVVWLRRLKRQIARRLAHKNLDRDIRRSSQR